MDIYIFIAIFISFLWGIQPIVHKHLLNKYNFITIMLISTIVNFSLILAVSITRNKEILADMNKLTFRDLFILVLVSSFTIFLANMMYYYILKNHESSIISALVYSSPVFTLIIAYIFLKERLDIYGISGIFLMILGVILVSNNNNFSKEMEFLSNK
jgi:drug/metabolite transporter (DMT)-like permease